MMPITLCICLMCEDVFATESEYEVVFMGFLLYSQPAIWYCRFKSEFKLNFFFCDAALRQQQLYYVDQVLHFVKL